MRSPRQETKIRIYITDTRKAVRYINVFTLEESRIERRLKREDVHLEQSILSQRRDPDSYPELNFLAEQFERMRFYREWNLGHSAPSRHPQQADLPQDSLLEDGSNLGLVCQVESLTSCHQSRARLYGQF